MSNENKLAEALRAIADSIRADIMSAAANTGHTEIVLDDAWVLAAVKSAWPLQSCAAEAAQPQAQSGEWVMVPKDLIKHMASLHDDKGCVLTVDMERLKKCLSAAPTQGAEAVPIGWAKDIDNEETVVSWSREPPEFGNDDWWPLYGRPQPAQDAKDAAIPLKGWIFDRVDMGRGDERYICTPDGANATTVRNESTSDHRERMLWMIADAMAKGSGNG